MSNRLRMMILMVCAALSVLFVSTAGAVPALITYQGEMRDAADTPLDGLYTMVFRIYDVENGGSALWGEQQSVDVNNGIYNVYLGAGAKITSGDDLGPTIFSSGDRWLEVSIESETLSPRQRISSVAFAFRAAEALYAETAGDSDSLDGLDSSAFIKTGGGTMTGSLNLIDDGLVAGTDQLVLSGGNVGIGTESPGEKLEVAGDGKFIAESGSPTSISMWNDDLDQALTLRQDTDGNSYLSNKADFFGNGANRAGHLILYGDGISLNYGLSGNAGSPALTIHNKTPSVGIGGGHTPTSLLDIANVDTGVAGLTIRGDAGYSNIPDSDGQIYLSTDISEGASGSGDFYFRTYDGTDYANKLVIKGSTGDVGIGTEDPEAKLEISDITMVTPTTDGILNIGRASSYHVTIDGDEIQSKNNTSPNNLFLNNYGGNIVMNRYGGSVGIGIYDPSEKLSVNGTIESVSGGFKFPDGSIQTTAHSTAHDNTTLCRLYLLTGNVQPDLCYPCSDGLDNDDDGLVDYPNDLECISPRDRWESLIAKLVFVTSRVYDGDLAGMLSPDEECMQLAAAVGIEGIFKAWISDGLGNSPDTTFEKATIPYALLDGTIIANNYTDLTDGTLQHAIDMDENGNPVIALKMWTGTLADGSVDPGSNHCDNWTSYSESLTGLVGWKESTSSQWSDWYAERCDLPGGLYCFEQ